MIQIIGKSILGLSVAAWLACAAGVIHALPQDPAAEAVTEEMAAVTEVEVVPSLVEGRVVDERGQGIGDAWLSLVAAGDPGVKASVSLDDGGRFAISELPDPGAETRWTLGDIGGYGHLPVRVSVERIDANDSLVGEAQEVDYTPGAAMPEFSIPEEGLVRIVIVMGEKSVVAARWAEARRKAREAAPRAETAQGPGIGDEASALWASGNEKFGAKDYAGAAADYAAALEHAPDESGLLSARASALYYVGDLEAARQAAEAALAAGASDLQLLQALADRFVKAGDLANARGVLASLERAAPDSAAVQLQRARLAKSEGDAPSAIAAYREATRRSPTDLKLWAEMAVYCREGGHEDCARSAYGSLVRLDPDYDKTAYYFLGALSEGPQAIAYFEKASAYLPEAHIKLCLAYREAEQTDQAVAACRRYLELKPEGSQADDVKAVLASLEP